MNRVSGGRVSEGPPVIIFSSNLEVLTTGICLI